MPKDNSDADSPGEKNDDSRGKVYEFFKISLPFVWTVVIGAALTTGATNYYNAKAIKHQELLDRRKEMVAVFYGIVNTCDLRSAYARRLLEGYEQGLDKVEGKENDEATHGPSPPAPSPAAGSIVSPANTSIALTVEDTIEKRWADYEKMIIYWKDNSYLNQVRYEHYFLDDSRDGMFGKENSVESQLDAIDKKLREIKSNPEKNNADTLFTANQSLDKVDEDIKSINLKMLASIDPTPMPSESSESPAPGPSR
jgi:hypothetical protein